MIAILLAAQIAAAAPVEFTVTNVTVTGPTAALRRNNVIQPQVLCPAPGTTEASDAASSLLRPQDRKNLRVRSLAELPKANKEVAVARTIGGCAVPVGIRYSVEGDGSFAPKPRP
jgi:hypothetical protein